MKLRLQAIGLALALSAAATVAQAQVSISTSPASSPALGTVVRGTSATTFSVSTAGAVTKSGPAIRLSSASVTAPTITLSCGLNTQCINRAMRITIAPSGTTGSASIAILRVGSLSGATYKNGAPTDASSLTFDLNPIGILTSVTFKVGMDVLVPTGAATGASTFNYTVTATIQ